MGATSGVHIAVEVATTSLNWTMRVHRPAEFAPSVIVAETAVAAALSQVAMPREDGRLVPVMQPVLLADSDQPGRSTAYLVGVAAWESVDWPWSAYIDHSLWIGCQQAPF